MQAALLLPVRKEGLQKRMGTKLGLVIAKGRKNRQMTLQQIADRVGVSYPAVQQWEKGKTTPSRENVPKLAQALGLPPNVLEAVLASEDRERELLAPPTEAELQAEAWNEQYDRAARERAQLPHEVAQRVEIGIDYVAEDGREVPRAFLIDQIPIFGIAIAGAASDGEFYFNGETVDYVKRPLGLRYSKSAYALYVVNDSMSPKFEPNDLIFINPDRPAVNNDYVVVELSPDHEGMAGCSYIKRLRKRTSTSLILEQFNPQYEFEVPLERVKSVHRIVTTKELLGL